MQDVVQLIADEIAPDRGRPGPADVLGSRAGRLDVLGHRGYPDLAHRERFDGTPLTERIPGAQVLRTGGARVLRVLGAAGASGTRRATGTHDGFAAWAFPLR